MSSKLLLVEPKNFDVTYTINPWMNEKVLVEKSLMVSQWEGIYKKLLEVGADVEILLSHEGLNDEVFAANAGMVYNKVAVPSRFKDNQRKSEEPYWEEWFRKNYHNVSTLSEETIWEGQACTEIWDKNAIFSISSRANAQAYQELIKIWGLEDYDYRYIDLIDPFFYHLDVCFTRLNRESALLCPMAFKGSDYSWIQSKFKNIVEVTYDDALNFSCNMLVLGKKILSSDIASQELVEKLKLLGFEYIPLNISEFIKSGGGVKCLILKR